MPISSDPLRAARRFDASAIDRTAAAVLDAVGRRMAAGAVHPDAELLEACVAAGALWRRNCDAFYGPARIVDDDERDAVMGPIWVEADVVLRSICDLPATTMQGHQARAATMLNWNAGALLSGQDTIENRLALALAADLLVDSRPGTILPVRRRGRP